jgi:GAF domain-containing protein
LTYTVAHGGEQIVVPDVNGHRLFHDWPWDGAIVGLPLCVGGKVRGVMNVAYEKPHVFSENELGVLELLADQAAIAIENARLFDALASEKKRLELLYGLARALAESLSLEEVAGRALRQTCSAVGAFKGILLLLNPSTDCLHFIAASGCEAESVEMLDRQIGLRVGRGLAGWVAAERCTAIVTDVSQDEHWLTVDGLDDWVRSALVVPLMVRDRLVGVLSLHSECLDAFDEPQRQLVQAVAAPVAVAIQNAQLYHQVTRRVREQTLLNRISGRFGAVLNVDALLNCALEGLQELVGADRTYFVTTDPDACTWETTHELVVPGIELDIGLSGAFDDVPVELEALLSGQPFAVSEIATDTQVEDMRETYRALGMQSMLLMPVQARGRLYGVLGFDFCREKHVWQPDEIRLLEGVAHQLELALENVRLLEEARLRADELATALARQEELDRLKDEFIQNVSHELRSPLTLICGYAEMLHTGELGELQPDQQQSVAIITRRAHMLKELVQDIMLILEAGGNPPEAEPVPLDELVLAAVEDFQVVTRQAGLTLQAEIVPHLPPVNGSPMYLRRMLDNLIGNASKFTPEGGTITVRSRQEGQWVALEVSDTGIGMPADKLERVFERFYQVDGSTKRKYGASWSASLSVFTRWMAAPSASTVAWDWGWPWSRKSSRLVVGV